MLPICILAIRDDDDRAYMTRLFVKYQRLMYRTIYDTLGDKWTTEDVLQTTLLRLIDHLDTLRRLEPEGLAGYIAAACRHTAYNAVRDSGRHPWLPLDGGPEVPDERQEVEDRVLRRLELNALAQVWPRLDENTRWLLEARYILDYSDGELARELGVKMPVGNLYSSDTFYDAAGRNDRMKKMGVMAVEMEAAALYCTAAYLGKRALAICSISDNLVLGTELTPQERQTTFTNMMKIGLEAAVKMAQRG